LASAAGSFTFVPIAFFPVVLLVLFAVLIALGGVL
jgi:hypothetical protein